MNHSSFIIHHSALVLLCAASLSAVTPASAQQYPARPVRVVVPYAAGGLPDTMARIAAPRLVESLGQQFVVDNRLAQAIAGAMRHPETVGRYTALGIDPVGNTPEQYAAKIRIDIAKYAKAVKAAGIKVD